MAASPSSSEWAEHAVAWRHGIDHRIELGMGFVQRPVALAMQRGNRAVQAAGALERRGNVGRGGPEVLGKHALAKRHDRAADARVVTRLEHQVALGVEPHGSVGQVRRAQREPE